MVSYIAYLNLKFNLFKNYFSSDCCVFLVAGFYHIFALLMISLTCGGIDCREWQLSVLSFFHNQNERHFENCTCTCT